MKTNMITTPTQTHLISLITKEVKQGNRIIFINKKGHVGLEFAIHTAFRHIKVMTFSELKEQKCSTGVFRFLNILASLLALMFNITQRVDTSSSITSLLDNIENVYRGINKEYSFLKFLHVTKFAHKYRFPRYAILIDVRDFAEDSKGVSLLYELVLKKKIQKSVLIVSQELAGVLCKSNSLRANSNTCYELTRDDLEVVSKNHGIHFTHVQEESVVLIQKLGLQFYIDNYHYIESLGMTPESNDGTTKKMERLVNTIIRYHHLDAEKTRNLFPLLEFSSFFPNAFTKLSIIKFENDQLKAENLTTACELSFIRQLSRKINTIPEYEFEKECFHVYFNERYCQDLQPSPEQIYCYFRKRYPFNYITALRVLKIDRSFVSYQEIQSLIIIGYYHDNISKGFAQVSQYQVDATRDSLAAGILMLYENFKRNALTSNNTNGVHIFDQLYTSNDMNDIAKCACYVLLLQVLKENYDLYPDINFSTILFRFKASILNISDDSLYFKYWGLHFKNQYIAFSLDDEQTDNVVARRFAYEIKLSKNNGSLNDFIKTNNLRGFDRIDLLSFSLGLSDAGATLKSLYEKSESSTIVKELARINYSAFLMENDLYDEACKLLQKTNSDLVKNINYDTYAGYCNNLFVSMLAAGNIGINSFDDKMGGLLESSISRSDRLIIETNLYSANLKFGMHISRSIAELTEIGKRGTRYTSFYALHNLLSYYYTVGDKEKFDEIYTSISVPKLLRTSTSFFAEKFKYMYNHIGKEDRLFDRSISVCEVPKGYFDLYIFSSIERWFE